MLKRLWRRLKLWNLKWRMRRTLKRTVFQPPLTGPRKTKIEYLDEFTEITLKGNKIFYDLGSRLKVPAVGPITEHYCGNMHDEVSRQLPLLSRLGLPDPWLGVDSRLPRECPLCGAKTVPSKVDDRMVACYTCKEVFLTAEALDDPNIQRDLTHCKAGISCKNRNDCKEDNDENDEND